MCWKFWQTNIKEEIMKMWLDTKLTQIWCVQVHTKIYIKEIYNKNKRHHQMQSGTKWNYDYHLWAERAIILITKLVCLRNLPHVLYNALLNMKLIRCYLEITTTGSVLQKTTQIDLSGFFWRWIFVCRF